MRRLVALVSASAVLAGLLLVPMASGVSAATFSYAGFSCGPNGSAAGNPRTTLSTVRFDPTAPANSLLTCLWRGTSLPMSFGGQCQFQNVAYVVEFARRTLFSMNGNTYLICSGGTVTLRQYTLTTIVIYGGDGGVPIFDNITYDVGGNQVICSNWPEDGTTACSATYDAFTVVSVTMTDDAQLAWECVPDFIENDTSPPFQGTCVVTMDADKTITVVGNLQL